MQLYYFHPSTYAQKVLIACKEKEVTFEPVIVNLFEESERNRYREIYPIGKVPLLVLDDGHKIPESSIIVEYLDQHSDKGPRLIPADPDASRQTRCHDRMLDLYLNESVAALVFESWKPEAERNAELIERSRYRAGVIYEFMETRLADRTWLMGDGFTIADCAAAPPLAYAREVFPFEGRKAIEDYWQRALRPTVVASGPGRGASGRGERDGRERLSRETTEHSRGAPGWDRARPVGSSGRSAVRPPYRPPDDDACDTLPRSR